MTNFRALCAELLEALENAIRIIYNEDGTKHISTADSVITKADAALAQPEPQGPTDEEAVALYSEVMAFHDCKTLGDMAGHFARAVLQRWGAPASQSVAKLTVQDCADMDKHRMSFIDEDSSGLITTNHL